MKQQIRFGAVGKKKEKSKKVRKNILNFLRLVLSFQTIFGRRKSN